MSEFSCTLLRLLVGYIFCPGILGLLATDIRANDKETETIEEVVVIGTYLKFADTFGSSSPLRVLDEELLAQQGNTDTLQIIIDQPYVMGSNARPGLGGGSLSANFVSAPLKGLDAGATLYLVNGKRVASSGNDLVPVIAIKRVETLLDGASALYGADAVAGVINFVTRRDFEGFELRLSSMTDDDTGNLDENNVSFIGGKSFDRGHATFSYEMFKHDEVNLHERNLPNAGDSLFGKTYRLREFFAPSAFGVHPDFARAYTGFAGFTQDLNCADDPGSIPGQSGLFCGFNFAGFFPIAYETDRHQVMLSLDYDLSESLKFYATYNYGDTENRNQYGDLPWINDQYVIPSFNPGLIEDAGRRGVPQGTPLTSLLFLGRGTLGVPGRRTVSGVGESDIGVTEGEFRNNRLLLGLKGDFNSSWQWDLSLMASEEKSKNTGSDQVSSRIQNGLAGLAGPNCDRDDPANIANAALSRQNVDGSGCYFYNPFLNSQFSTGGTPQTDSSLINDETNVLLWVNQPTIERIDVTSLTVDLLVTGDLIEFNDRMVRMAAGVQWRDSEVARSYDEFSRAGDFAFTAGNENLRDKRSVAAVFSELAIPLTDTLDIQVALRHEKYTREELKSTDPKISLLWQPIDDLSIRASYSTAFRAPNLRAADGNSTSTFFATIADPANGGAATGAALVIRGNDNLDPYDGKTLNVGFSWYPVDGWFSGAELDLDFYSLEYNDLVVIDTPEGILAVDPFDSRVIRSDSGIITRIETEYINAGKSTQEGVEFRASYPLPESRLGDFLISVEGLKLSKMEMQLYDSLCACLSKIDGLGRRNHDNPFGAIQDFKAHATIRWQLGQHTAAFTWRYVGSYENSGQGTAFVTSLLEQERGYSCLDSSGNTVTSGVGCKIDSHRTLDVMYQYQLPSIGSLYSAGSIVLGAINITNEDPPPVAMDMGFDVTTHDPRGRLWYVKYKLSL